MNLAHSVCFGEGLVGNIFELLWEVTRAPARGVPRHNGEGELGLDFLTGHGIGTFHGRLSVFECGRVHVVETSQSSLHMRNITHVASYLPDPAAALLKVGSQSAVHLKHKYTRQELTRLTHPACCLTINC